MEARLKVDIVEAVQITEDREVHPIMGEAEEWLRKVRFLHEFV
jgi:hypothetical protein